MGFISFVTQKKQRPVSDQERGWHLTVDAPAGKPHASATVIRLNSSYLEVVDGLYLNRGAMSAFGVFALTLFGYALLSIFYTVLKTFLDPEWDRHDIVSMSLSLTFGSVLLIVTSAGVIAFNRAIGEWFRYTHYPIRLNRKNRMVYVFRSNGSILATPWDKTYFTLYVAKSVAGTRWLGICGLVMKDADIVEEQFMFGFSSPKESDCRRHWEFMRSFMEDGPQAVVHAEGFKYCLPIADKRETLREGWTLLVSNDAWNPIAKWLMFPFHVLFFVGRLVWRATSKVPLWPAEVEKTCRIEPGDPFIRDSKTNPEGFR